MSRSHCWTRKWYFAQVERLDSSYADEKLIEMAQGGRLEAFDLLVERHFGLVYLIAYGRLKNREAAEDLAQEVFLRAYLNLAKFKAPYNFPAWIGRITRNLAINWLKHDQRVSRLNMMVALDPERSEDALFEKKNARKMMELQERDSAIREAVFKLPEKQREMVLMRYVGNLNDREIARRLGMHSSTVGRQIAKALSTMRTPLEDLLTDWGKSERPQGQAVIRTTALIAAAAALSPASKAAMAAAAGKAVAVGAGQAAGLGVGSAAVSVKVISGPLMASLAAFWGMLGAKFSIVTAICLIGLLGVISHRYLIDQSLSSLLGNSGVVTEQELREINKRFEEYQAVCLRRDLIGAITAWDVTTAGMYGGVTSAEIQDRLKSMFREYAPELDVIGGARFESINLLTTPVTDGRYVVLKAVNPYWVVRITFHHNSQEWRIVQNQIERQRPRLSPPPNDMKLIEQTFRSYQQACGQYDADRILSHWDLRRLPAAAGMTDEALYKSMKDAILKMAQSGALKQMAGQSDYSVSIMPGQKDVIELRGGNCIWHFVRTPVGWRIVYQEEYLMVNDGSLLASRGLSGVAVLN